MGLATRVRGCWAKGAMRKAAGQESRIEPDFIAYSVERAFTKMNIQAARLLSERAGLSVRQWWILYDMMTEDVVTASDLIEVSDIDKGLLSRNLKALRGMGLIETVVDEDDRRQQRITVTAKGRAKFDETLPIMRARNSRLIENVSENDLATTKRVLAAVAKAAESDPT